MSNRWTTGEQQVGNGWETSGEQEGNTWYTYLQTGDGEVGYETNNFRVVFYFDQLPQLVVTLQSGQQTTELVVVVWIRQTLKHKHDSSLNGRPTTQETLQETWVCGSGVWPTCGLASILFTPSTKCERNFARSALLKRDRLTEAIWTRHDNTCTHKHNVRPQTGEAAPVVLDGPSWCHLPTGKGTEGWNDINWKRAAGWRNQETLQDRNKTGRQSSTRSSLYFSDHV